MTDLAFWIVMLGVTLATSVLSGVLGMAGGMVLLAVLLSSNASRAWFLREHVRARVLWRFVLPLLPAAALGVFLLGRLPPAVGRVLIGVFVLGATLRPASTGAAAERRIAPERLLPVG